MKTFVLAALAVASEAVKLNSFAQVSALDLVKMTL
jgi:hypothetical protein